MQFIRFDQEHLGLLANDGIVGLANRLGLDTTDPLVEYINGDYDANEYVDAEPDYDRSKVEIKSPVKHPGKVIAAPLNYENHIEEAIADKDITTDEWFSIEDKGYFLKAPSSVVEPDHNIKLPFDDCQVGHGIELVFTMGEDTKDVDSDEIWNNIFGYTILLGILVRGDQDRSNRKSYDTFTVVGPSVVTPDRINDPQNLDMQLGLNGEIRQDASTSDTVYTCADIIQYASVGATLETGDIVTTGTPEGVSKLSDGDTIEAEIENVGSMTVDVTQRNLSFAGVNVQKGDQ